MLWTQLICKQGQIGAESEASKIFERKQTNVFKNEHITE